MMEVRSIVPAPSGLQRHCKMRMRWARFRALVDAGDSGSRTRRSDESKSMSECFQTFNIAMPTLTKEIISAAILGFEEQRRRLDAQVAELRAMLSPSSDGSTPSPKPRGRRKRRMSAAGRAAIVAALKKRWAAKKAA